MSKRIVACRNAVLVPATSIWPNHPNKLDVVMRAELVSSHPVLGEPDEFDNTIRTSLVVNQDWVNGRVETLNTIYQVVV